MSRTTQRIDAAGACPRCGTPLPMATGLASIDRPIEPCTSCGNLVMRPGTNEWHLLKPGQRLGHVARHTLGALAAGPALALVHRLVALGQGRTWEFRDALLWLAIGWVLAGAWAGSRLAARVRRSRRRMGDPMYMAKLVEQELAAISKR